MKYVAVTQRVDVVESYGERRDGLDQNWIAFLSEVGYLPLVLPNDPQVAIQMVTTQSCAGLLLTGGNDLHRYGGDAPERDETEQALFAYFSYHKLPIAGVCRGMQFILDRAGAELNEVAGHIEPMQTVDIDGQASIVNSYHRWAARSCPSEYRGWAWASDGVLKAIRHRSENIMGIMWHPERIAPFRQEDIASFRRLYQGQE